MNAVDTNVLIYAHDPRDPAKQDKAVEVIASLTDGVLLWQVACEYVAASRKLEGFGFGPQNAWADLRKFSPVVDCCPSNMAISCNLRAAHAGSESFRLGCAADRGCFGGGCDDALLGRF